MRLAFGVPPYRTCYHVLCFAETRKRTMSHLHGRVYSYIPLYLFMDYTLCAVICTPWHICSLSRPSPFPHSSEMFSAPLLAFARSMSYSFSYCYDSGIDVLYVGIVRECRRGWIYSSLFSLSRRSSLWWKYIHHDRDRNIE